MPPSGPVRIELNVLGETQINRRLMRWSVRAADFAPVFEGILEFLERVEEAEFESEGAYAGSPWAQLAASTVVAKERAGLDPRILHATLALRNSLTKSDDPEAIRIATPSMMVFGTTVPYGKYHQSGTSRMPRRRPVDLTEKNKAAIIRAMQFWITRGGVTESQV